MTLSPQAKAIYQQYLKTNKLLNTLKEKEQVMVFHLVNGDGPLDRGGSVSARHLSAGL